VEENVNVKPDISITENALAQNVNIPVRLVNLSNNVPNVQLVLIETIKLNHVVLVLKDTMIMVSKNVKDVLINVLLVLKNILVLNVLKTEKINQLVIVNLDIMKAAKSVKDVTEDAKLVRKPENVVLVPIPKIEKCQNVNAQVENMMLTTELPDVMLVESNVKLVLDLKTDVSNVTETESIHLNVPVQKDT